jgi:hypothetical protein
LFFETDLRGPTLLTGVIAVLVGRERLARITVLSVGLFVLSQMWVQLVMEISFPLAVRVGPLTAVLFLH